MIRHAEVIMGTVRYLNGIAVNAAIIGIATLGASVAQADGMDRVAPAAYVRPFTWTGFYAGANVGYGWGTTTDCEILMGITPTGTSASVTPT